MTIDSLCTSTVLPRNNCTISMIWLRATGSAFILIKIISRRTAVSSSSTILITSTSLLSCLVICSKTAGALAPTWTVIRLSSGRSVGPTASDSML